MNRHHTAALFIGAVCAGSTTPGLAQASARNDQPSATDAPSTEILVTARKRSESDLKVPIAISALGKEQLDRYNIVKLADVAAITPTLNVSTNFGSFGGNIALRGISTSPLNAASEQSVALNFDGVTVSTGAAIRFSQFDLERVEVLKGPQSLYFGKNTTAGIISLVSADPTPHFFAQARTGYEFNAKERTSEFIVSGPIAGERLTARLALFQSSIDGWLNNPIASTSIRPSPAQVALLGPWLGAKYSDFPHYRDYAGRLTLKYEPTDDITVRLRGTYAKRRGGSSNQSAQLFYCGSGVPAPGSIGNIAGIGKCGLNTNEAAPVGQFPTAAQTGDPRFRDGLGFEKDKQYLLQASVDARLTNWLSFNSTTGYYSLKYLDASSITLTPLPTVGGLNDMKKTDFSQELRLTSDTNSPIDFVVGGFFNKGTFHQDIPLTIIDPTVLIPGSKYSIPNKVYSVFGNVNLALLDRKIILSAGGRYTRETKSVVLRNQLTNDIFTGLARDKIKFNSFNPELTASWIPTDRVNTYITYKKGSKSGGFTADTLTPIFPGLDLSYGDETVEGFEGGVKAVLAGGALRLDLSAFRYNFKDLQVGNLDTATAQQSISNAGRASLRGFEVTTTYNPSQVRGLSITGSVNYNKARYTKYLGVCYVGQTVALGCNLTDTGGPADGVTVIGTRQNYAGRPLIRAPDWGASLNASFERQVMPSGTSIGISVGGTYIGSFFPMTPEPPQSKQRDVTIINSTVRVFNDDRGWELALIGNNLTDKRRIQIGIENPFTPGLPTGTGSTGPSNYPDLSGFTNRPMQVILRLTVSSKILSRR